MFSSLYLRNFGDSAFEYGFEAPADYDPLNTDDSPVI